MTIVHVSDFDYVNPDDVVRVKGFPLDLAINVYLRSGEYLTRYVSEEAIAYHMEPSSSDPEKWSQEQKRLYDVITMGNTNYRAWSGARIDNDHKRFVACHMPCKTREEAFGLELGKFVAQFKK